MSITLATLRQGLAKSNLMPPSGITFTTTSDGAAGGTTAICSDFITMDSTNDTRKGWWILLTSGTYGGSGTVASRERLVRASTQSTGTFTFPAYGGQIVSGVTFELYNYQPSLLLTHLNRSIHESYPTFQKRWDDRNLVSGNMLPSSHFEDWASSSVPDSWTGSYAGCTVSEESTIKRFGLSSAKIIRASSTGASLSISSATVPLLLDNSEHSIDFLGWNYSATGLTCQLKLTPSSGTAGTSGYQSLGSAWELLKIEGYSVPADITMLTASLEMDAAATAYWDNVAMFGVPVHQYLLPTGIQRVSQVFVGNDWEEYEYQDDYEVPRAQWESYLINGSYYLRFTTPVIAKRKLRVVGYGYFTDLSADTDTLDLEPKQGDTIFTGAAAYLLKSMAQGKGTDERLLMLKDANDLLQDFHAGLAKNATNLPLVSRYSRPDSWG